MSAVTTNTDGCPTGYYHRKILGHPDRFDKWVADEFRVRSKEETGQNDVRCTLWVERTQADDSTDPDHAASDIFTLYLRAYASPEFIQGRQRCSPIVIFRRYEGCCFDTDAPLWALWPEGDTESIWQSRGHIAKLFVALAFQKHAIVEPGVSVAAIQWAQPLLVGTSDEQHINEFIARHGFVSTGDPVDLLWTNMRRSQARSMPGHIAKLLMTISTWKDVLRQPGMSADLLQWAQLIAAGTPDEQEINRRMVLHGFEQVASD